MKNNSGFFEIYKPAEPALPNAVHLRDAGGRDWYDVLRDMPPLASGLYASVDGDGRITSAARDPSLLFPVGCYVVQIDGDYEPDDVRGKFYADGQITDVPETEKYQQLIHERDDRLAKTDWLVLRDIDERTQGNRTLLDSELVEVTKYRQALRDLPQKCPTSDKWTWPDAPLFI